MTGSQPTAVLNPDTQQIPAFAEQHLFDPEVISLKVDDLLAYRVGFINPMVDRPSSRRAALTRETIQDHTR